MLQLLPDTVLPCGEVTVVVSVSLYVVTITRHSVAMWGLLVVVSVSLYIAAITRQPCAMWEFACCCVCIIVCCNYYQTQCCHVGRLQHTIIQTQQQVTSPHGNTVSGNSYNIQLIQIQQQVTSPHVCLVIVTTFNNTDTTTSNLPSWQHCVW